MLQSLLGYIWTVGSAGTSLQDLSYTHDNLGNITSITDVLWSASREFTYDGLNRLTSATGNFGVNQALTTQFYRYDAIGNILEKAGVLYTYNNPAHPSAVSSTSDGKTYTYDNNGNMVTGGNRSMVWDFDNRVTSVTTGGVTASMDYDYTGTRVKKNGSGGTTYFPFSGYEEGPGTLRTKYIRIGIENIASKKSTGEKLFYHNDHLGGVNVITNDSGLLAQIIEYDPWGKVSRQEGSGESLRRFTGKILDPESGLYYYGGRYYDPELGRFISPDPFVGDPFDPQNLNRYSYVVNNPVNAIDPDGYNHQPKAPKKKKHHAFSFFGFLRIIFGVFLIMTGQPHLVFAGLLNIASGASAQFTDKGAQIFSKITGGLAGLATGPPSDGGGGLFSLPCIGSGPACGPGASPSSSGQGGGTVGAASSVAYSAGQFAAEDGTEIDFPYLLLAGCTIVPTPGEGLFGGGGLGCAGGGGGGGRGGGVGRGGARGGGPGAMRRPQFEPSPKHGPTPRGPVSAAPKHGQGALDVSVRVKPTSTMRVGIDYDTGEFVVFNETTPGVFHGHVRPWDQLTQEMQNSLREGGMVNQRGRILD